MKLFKILILTLLFSGCIDSKENRKKSQKKDEPFDLRTSLIKSINKPYFVSNIESKTINVKRMIFFDSTIVDLNHKEQFLNKDKYSLKLVKDNINCCFDTVLTGNIELITEDKIVISFAKKVKIKFIGYNSNVDVSESYFKISSLDDFVYLTIIKRKSNNRYLIEISDYIKLNNKLY